MPFISIPIAFESPQSYEYMGVTADIAHQLYEARLETLEDIQREQPDEPDWGVDFESYLTDNGVQVCKAALQANGTDWVRAMSIAGIRKDLQKAIMDPEFEDVGGMQSLPVWLWETFGINFRTLKNTNERILAQSVSLPSAPLRGGGSDDEDTVPLPPSDHLALSLTTPCNGSGITPSPSTISTKLSRARCACV
jgi:hypothetical protein